MRRFRKILMVNTCTITGDAIGKLREENPSVVHLNKILPEWVVRTDTGYIDHSEYYLQFTMEGEAEFTLFDIVGMDTFLDFELGNEGLDGLLRGIDVRPLFSKLGSYKFDELYKFIPSASNIVIDLIYTGGEFSCGEYDDSEMEVKLVGYLDNDLKLCEI